MKPSDIGYPHPSSPVATTIMKANRPTETGPERRLRSALHRAGLRFRKNQLVVVGGVRSRPDAVFLSSRVAVFVDGCFWHSCPQHGTLPSSNAAYWGPKLARNVERDRRVRGALRAAGWRVVRVWEHEDFANAARRVMKAVGR